MDFIRLNYSWEEFILEGINGSLLSQVPCDVVKDGALGIPCIVREVVELKQLDTHYESLWWVNDILNTVYLIINKAILRSMIRSIWCIAKMITSLLLISGCNIWQ